MGRQILDFGLAKIPARVGNGACELTRSVDASVAGGIVRHRCSTCRRAGPGPADRRATPMSVPSGLCSRASDGHPAFDGRDRRRISSPTCCKSSRRPLERFSHRAARRRLQRIVSKCLGRIARHRTIRPCATFAIDLEALGGHVARAERSRMARPPRSTATPHTARPAAFLAGSDAGCRSGALVIAAVAAVMVAWPGGTQEVSRSRSRDGSRPLVLKRLDLRRRTADRRVLLTVAVYRLRVGPISPPLFGTSISGCNPVDGGDPVQITRERRRILQRVVPDGDSNSLPSERSGGGIFVLRVGGHARSFPTFGSIRAGWGRSEILFLLGNPEERRFRVSCS
jgi:hypothetical protein